MSYEGNLNETNSQRIIVATNNNNSTLSLNNNRKQFSDLNGLLVSYKDDQLNECVKLALKRKTRVRYKCMDTFSNFLAFGTSGGAIYLFKLKSITHSSCSLISMIPCDQGSIEVIKFLPNPQTDNLLIAIGTKRGSLVIFKLSQVINTGVSNFSLNDQNSIIQQHIQQHTNPSQQAICVEIYRAEGFTNNNAIKLIEYDQDLLDPSYPFNKLYVCDSTNRLYVLDSTTIYAFKQTLRLFYSNHLPSLIFSVTDSEINQINVQRSQLLISTNETTRLFNEQTNQIYTIGTQKRRQGFYGACFFNPIYKPLRILHIGGVNQQQQANINNIKRNGNNQQANSQQTVYSSTTSINDLENLLIFVARPSFRLWQVNYERKVKLTHQFEPLIKNSPFAGQIVELDNKPIDIDNEEERVNENFNVIIDKFKPTLTLNAENSDNNDPNSQSKSTSTQPFLKSDHFQKLIHIYSSTLGNLILSYTQHELFVVDPIGAKLIVWHSFWPSSIVQVCCSENELFIWTRLDGDSNEHFKVERLVLLAPTQFILELHRLHRYWTMILFVQLFSDLFRHRMALPLGGNSIITTEGGLLRNVLLNAWDIYENNNSTTTTLNNDTHCYREDEQDCSEFKRIIDEIVDESRQLKQSLENLTDSRFFLTMTSENIDRLCSEPYASLVSLEVSIADLHSNHVIHFSKEALNRHKSVANLSRNLSSMNKLNQQHSDNNNHAKSNFNLTSYEDSHSQESNNTKKESNNNNKVIVERLKPTRKISSDNKGKEEDQNQTSLVSTKLRDNQINQPFFSIRESKEPQRFNDAVDDVKETSNFSTSANDKSKSQQDNRVTSFENDLERRRKEGRCEHCHWPYKRIHLRHLDSIQQIQIKWIETNLSDNFEENLEQIQEIAFKHGLWRMFLKCLAFKNQLDDYITCCMVLNDVRLLNSEQFTKTSCTQEELLDKILIQLTSKIVNQSKQLFNNDNQTKEERIICYKCNKEIVIHNDQANNYCQLEPDVNIEEEYENSSAKIDQDDDDDEFSFNLPNLFDQFSMKRHADVKKIVHQLLNYPELLNSCKLNSTFYLKAISTLITNQSPLRQKRLDQFKGT